MRSAIQSLDIGEVFVREGSVAMSFDLAAFDVDDRDLVHPDSPLAGLCVAAEHKDAILADAKVIVWQRGAHAVHRYIRRAQKSWMRVQASFRTSSEVT